MPNKEVEISIVSNNSELETLLLSENVLSEIKFVKENKNTGYRTFWIDLSRDLSNISQNLINQYGHCRENNAKLVVVVLHKDSVDTEKNHYFQKMLEDLGKNSPLHRLIFTIDLYQKSSNSPITPLDNYIFESLSSNNINISEKGKNIVFPLCLSDFIKALTRTLFLTNTSGQNFWVLGDPVSELEFAYLIKKNSFSSGHGESDINASKKNDPKTNALLGIGNKTRGDLNWNPENDIYEDIKQISLQYSKGTDNKEAEKAKINIVHKFILWAYKPRPKKEKSLPTIKKILFKLASTTIAIVILIGVVGVVATGVSLKQLERSLGQTLTGDIKKSVNSLQSSKKFKKVGEYTFSIIMPLSNIISPKGTTKIANTYSFIDYSSRSLENLHQTYVLAEKLLISLSPSEPSINFNDLSLALHSNLSQIYENLNQIRILSDNKLPVFLHRKIKENEEFQNLQELEGQIVQFIKISDIIPVVFSSESSKNILVLLQNSQISKPSGGELNTFLMLTLSEGKLLSKKYFTPQEINTLSEASVSSSIKNKRFTPSKSTVQELAENPNFPSVASDISLRFEKTVDIKPDFVIAINEFLVKQLYFEEKSGDFEQFSQEIMNSSASAVFKEVVDGYLDRLFKNNITLPTIGRTLAKMIEDNHVLLWSSRPVVQKTISTQSYSGEIKTHSCYAGIAESDVCYSDTSYLVESNVHDSRISPWESRTISHDISITTSNIQHEYQLNYKAKQTSPDESYVSTVYHLYSPPSTLDQILVNDLPASTKEVKKSSENALDHYTIPLVLPSNRDTTLILKYTTQKGSNLTAPISYSLTQYRQPGTTDTGISLKVSYPENLRPTIATTFFEDLQSQVKLTLPPHVSTFGFTLDQKTQ